MRVLLLLFQSGFLLFHFSFLIAVARTSKPILNSSGKKVGTLILFFILEEMLSVFFFFPPIEANVHYVFVACGFYYGEVCSFYAYFLERVFITYGY